MPQACFSLVVSLIVLLLLCLNIFLSEKDSSSSNKQSWFESGIENKLSSRNSFSINFFLICIIFVMFDLEIVFLFNFIVSVPMEFFLEMTIQLGFLILFFFVTLIIEWKASAISWKF